MKAIAQGIPGRAFFAAGRGFEQRTRGQSPRFFQGLAANIRFHWVKVVGEQPIDRQNCETGALDRSHWAIRSAQILAVFEDGERDISRISLKELG